MKKEFVTLKEALPGFVAECIKVANRENPMLEDFHVGGRRSLNYYLKKHIELSLHIDKGDKIERRRSMLCILQHAYKAINWLLRGRLRNYIRVIFYDGRYCLLNTEGEDRYRDLSSLIFGVTLYIFEMLDEDNFNLFRLTESLWSKECQSNDIYKRLKNDEELADLANRKVWRLWTEDDDDKEVEDVEKEEAGKEEAGKEITSGESSPINEYFKKSVFPLPKDKIKEAVEFCKTISNLAILKLVFERKRYTSCISNHLLFIDTLCAMGLINIINKKDRYQKGNNMKDKYYRLTDEDYKWRKADEIIYDALMEIFKEESFD